MSAAPLQILHLMACTESCYGAHTVQYNTAEVLQVESLINNGEASVLFMSCVGTVTVAALLMELRLS